MIQRKQTLFLLELVFLGIALLFVPNSTLVTSNSSVNICLLPLQTPYVSTAGHYLAIALNFTGIVLSVIAIFLYKHRGLQLKICYALTVLWALLGFMLGFWHFVKPGNEVLATQTNYSGVVISVFAVAAALLAARFIRKDIDLLKSADRIR
jgi:hypothetical protein